MKVSPLRQETEAGSGPAAAHKPAQEQASVMIEIDHVTQVFQTSARKDHLALLDILSKMAPSSPFSDLPAAASRRCSISSAASSVRRKARRRCGARRSLDRVCLSEFKLARTDDEVCREMA
jgi:hypothetical protein